MKCIGFSLTKTLQRAISAVTLEAANVSVAAESFAVDAVIEPDPSNVPRCSGRSGRDGFGGFFVTNHISQGGFIHIFIRIAMCNEIIIDDDDDDDGMMILYHFMIDDRWIPIKGIYIGIEATMVIFHRI